MAPQNMRTALKRVEQNKGAAGVDGMTAKELRPFLLTQWSSIKEALLGGTYQPQPVKRVEIPKATGGVRLLGIPTVLDRLIQQAVLQVLTPIFDPHFSPASYGFRPGKRGHDAVRAARAYVREGYAWVVDLDLEKFFDRVNHDMLMARVARKVSDKPLLGLIRRFLESGVLVGGLVSVTEEGTPQGGPLSPLLSNVVLDDLDKELERRGHKFVRYADDCNIYVRTRRSGERVKASVTAFLETRLHLRINEGKSAVDRPWKRKFLGFTLYVKDERIQLAEASVKRVKEKIRSLTQRSAGISQAERIKQLNQYLGGWMGYFALSELPSLFQELDSWLRRRLRMCQWKQWKRTHTRVRELRALGLKEPEAWAAAGSRKSYWRIASSPPLHKALSNAYWQARGLVALADRYRAVRNAW
ncbi:MAG: group II intron reverse transcriptase/maturase [Chloroflexota bacterium]|nr:group II intron reverse transcriptase/maturase [Chloroflexota bacterium]